MATTLQVSQSFTDRFAEGYKRTTQGIVIMATVAAEVRDAYGYQGYVAWLHDKFGLKPTIAVNLLAIHKNLLTPNFGVEVDWQQFGPSALYALAAPSVPEAARKEAIARAEAGEKITHAVAKQLTAKHSPPPEPPPRDDRPTFFDRTTDEDDDDPHPQSEDDAADDDTDDWSGPDDDNPDPGTTEENQQENDQQEDDEPRWSLKAPATPAPDPDSVAPATVKFRAPTTTAKTPPADTSDQPISAENMEKFINVMKGYLGAFRRNRYGLMRSSHDWSPLDVRAAIFHLQDLGEFAFGCANQLKEAYGDEAESLFKGSGDTD